MPYAIISMADTFIEEQFGEQIQRSSKSGTLNLEIETMYPIADRDADNTFFAIENSIASGWLPFIERFLDAINTDPSELVNPRLQNSARAIGIEVGEPVRTDTSIRCTISLIIKYYMPIPTWTDS